jgi:hypothetical protein
MCIYIYTYGYIYISVIFFPLPLLALVVFSHAIRATRPGNWWGVNCQLRSSTTAEIVEAKVAQKRLGFAPVWISQLFLSR